MNIIGITGYAQHGKNTVAELIKSQINPALSPVHIVAFADALRDLALDVDPIIYDPKEYHDEGDVKPYSTVLEEEGYERAKTHYEVRRFLQALGVGVRNVIGEDAWVQALTKKISYFPNNATVLIPDVRFPNEAAFIKRNGQLWAVTRVNEDYTEFNNGVGTGHVSESHVAYLKLQADVQVYAHDLETLRRQIAGNSNLEWLAEQKIMW